MNHFVTQGKLSISQNNLCLASKSIFLLEEINTFLNMYVPVVNLCQTRLSNNLYSLTFMNKKPLYLGRLEMFKAVSPY